MPDKPPASTGVARATAPEDAEWISKEEAASLIRIRRGKHWYPISVRRVLEFAEAGALTHAKRRDPKSGQMTTVLLRADVMRLKEERENPAAVAVVLPQPRAMVPAAPKPKRLPAVEPPPPARQLRSDDPFLTLAEAERYICLPESYLLALIVEGRLPHLNVGRRPGGQYRVKCSDLDEIQGKAQSTVVTGA